MRSYLGLLGTIPLFKCASSPILGSTPSTEAKQSRIATKETSRMHNKIIFGK